MIYTLIILQLLSAITFAIDEPCTPNNGIESGKCQLVTNCESALRSIRTSGSHSFKRCGFDGIYEIVCCPESAKEKFGTNRDSPSTSQTKKRIADQVCEELVKNSVPPLDLHIIGGEVATPDEFPHMAALGYDRGNGYVFDCGGAIVSERFVLTAAHCVDTLDRVEPEIVRVGVVDIDGSQFNPDTDYRIAQIVKHPNYDRKLKYNDLTLLRLEKAIPLGSNPNAACLYTSSKDPTNELTITGWGTISNIRDVRSKVLKKANVTIFDRESCSKHYTNWRKLPEGITALQVCAGDGEGLRDTCQGDSGGPLQTLTTSDGLYRIVGVTSFGRGCGSVVPGVYTRVSSFLDWIEKEVWPNGVK